MRISLLTCGHGEELWETFGHACLRVIDSTKNDAERDKIYNYGFFEASEGNTIWSQAFSDRVIDLLDTITYEELMIEYRYKKRSIIEQEFILTDEQKRRVLAYLRTNLKKENRYYEFDTFYDNCSTRILGMFVKLFGSGFRIGHALPDGSRITFRDVTVTRLCPPQRKYWFGLAVGLFYASRTDRIMTNSEAMFLPAILNKGFASATIDGKSLCAPPITIQEEGIKWPAPIDVPLLMFVAIAILTLTGLSERTMLFYNIYSNILFVATGLLGWFMIYLWKMDGEPAWKDNLNILWALPTNILLPFVGRRVKAGYAVAAIGLIGVSMLLHILRIQEMPLYEIMFLLLALLWMYGMLYRRNIKVRQLKRV